MLLRLGANPEQRVHRHSARRHSWETPGGIAAQYGHNDIVDFFISTLAPEVSPGRGFLVFCSCAVPHALISRCTPGSPLEHYSVPLSCFELAPNGDGAVAGSAVPWQCQYQGHGRCTCTRCSSIACRVHSYCLPCIIRASPLMCVCGCVCYQFGYPSSGDTRH